MRIASTSMITTARDLDSEPSRHVCECRPVLLPV